MHTQRLHAGCQSQRQNNNTTTSIIANRIFPILSRGKICFWSCCLENQACHCPLSNIDRNRKETRRQLLSLHCERYDLRFPRNNVFRLLLQKKEEGKPKYFIFQNSLTISFFSTNCTLHFSCEEALEWYETAKT